MARIQILELPMRHVGPYSETPFALVIDQVETASEQIQGADGSVVRETVAAELTQAEADELAARVGAVGAILAACTIEVA